MKFCYSVGPRMVLNCIEVPLESGKSVLITGSEGPALRLIGGILGRMFPIRDRLSIPQLQPLVEAYTGHVVVQDGDLPQNAAYVGDDPERHLLFAKVWEEFSAREGEILDSAGALAAFGLGPQFLSRTIASLSGGEKARVGLAIELATTRRCYVFHGVVPWLDRAGRLALVREIQRVKEAGASVVLLEQEPHAIQEAIDRVVLFKDGATLEIDPIGFFLQPHLSAGTLDAARELSRQLREQEPVGHATEQVLDVQGLSLRAAPGGEGQRPLPLLSNISFALGGSSLTALVGENGAGKSTLAEVIMRAVRPDAGLILLCGKPLSQCQRQEITETIAYVGQFPQRQITLSRVGQYEARIATEKRSLAAHLLERYLRLPSGHPVAMLTPLEARLLCLASSLGPRTKLVILDEPTWGLDDHGMKVILEALADVAHELHPAILVISHNHDLVDSLCPEVLSLENQTVTRIKGAGMAPIHLHGGTPPAGTPAAPSFEAS